jgi:hypothetical protein
VSNKTIVCVAYKGDRGHVHGEAVDALKYRIGTPFISVVGCAYVGKARSVLASSALEQGADVVFFIDSDTIFDPSDVERVADVARQTRGVVGVPYSQRLLGGLAVGGFDESVVDQVTFFEGGGRYPASGVIGMGFTAIHQDVFRKMEELPDMQIVSCIGHKCRPYFRELTVGGNWLHEDASFCHLARRLGFPTELDTRFRLRHVGEHAFRIEDCLNRVEDKSSLVLQIRR